MTPPYNIGFYLSVMCGVEGDWTSGEFASRDAQDICVSQQRPTVSVTVSGQSAQ